LQEISCCPHNRKIGPLGYFGSEFVPCSVLVDHVKGCQTLGGSSMPNLLYYQSTWAELFDKMLKIVPRVFRFQKEQNEFKMLLPYFKTPKTLI